jgi:hypothetical protein
MSKIKKQSFDLQEIQPYQAPNSRVVCMKEHSTSSEKQIRSEQLVINGINFDCTVNCGDLFLRLQLTVETMLRHIDW